MAIALIGGLAALGSAGAGIYGASQAAGAQSQQMAALQRYQDTVAKQLGASTANANQLLGSQEDPADVFKRIFAQLPGELSQAFPTFEKLSSDAATNLTQTNVNNWQSVLRQVYPGWNQLNADELKQINNLNPANLGTEEILGTTRSASPLIPAGTLDPNTGSVAGGTTNPVSLYRNLVNGMYDQRRQQFLGASSQYLTNADNSAARQEVQAQQFMGELLQGSLQVGTNLTGDTVQQQQSNINNAMGQINTLLGLQAQGFNPAPFQAGISSGINTAAGGLGSLAKLFSPTSQYGGGTASLAGTIQGGSLSGPGHSIGASPFFDSAGVSPASSFNSSIYNPQLPTMSPNDPSFGIHSIGGYNSSISAELLNALNNGPSGPAASPLLPLPDPKYLLSL